MECIVLAAGEGKRMRPLTATRPKVMLPVANRPMLEHLMLAARDAGFQDFIFVVGYKEQRVREYFSDGAAWALSIRYVSQRRQLGTADALRMTKDIVERDFLLLNGDMLLASADIQRLAQLKAPSMAIFPTEHPENYGIVKTDGDCVTALIEKSPEPATNLINAGAYILNQEIYDILSAIDPSERGEYELTDALQTYIRAGALTSLELNSWYDIGAPWNLLDANEMILGAMEHAQKGVVEAGVTLSGGVSIGEGTVIKSGTYIEGPCIIGKNCRIGPHAYIRGATSIGDGCHIGHSTEIKNSVIFHDTKIPHFNYIGDSVIGSGCNFGAGTKIANLRHDRKIVRIGGKSTGRKKFGAVIGDGVQFGINCSINVGTTVGKGVRCAPHTCIEGEIAEGTIIR